VTIPLEQQIAEVKYELAIRRNVYKRHPPKNPEQHMERMEAALHTLQWMQGHNVAPGAARPADLVAALAHIRRNLEGSQPESKGEHFIKVIDDVLAGIQVPLLGELARAAAAVLEPKDDGQ
jgi:hypothetical protein